MYDVNDLLPADSGVTAAGLNGSGAINDFGQIVGYGTINGEQHAVLLTPVPAAEATPVQANTNYSAVPPVTNSNTASATTAALVGGSASSDTTVQISFSSSLAGGGSTFQAASDPVNVSGTGLDFFVLQVSYNKDLAVAKFGSENAVRLMWFDPNQVNADGTTGAWKLAVAGNKPSNTLQTFIPRAYDPSTDFVLGNHGLDTANHVVWAVINHNSQFVVSGNQAPVVNAGPDQTISTRSATLAGSGVDEGLPNPPAALRRPGVFPST